jgi:hypothetical protein
MKKVLISLMVALCAGAVMAQGNGNGNNDNDLAPAKEFHVQGWAKPGGQAKPAQGLTYHTGGVVIRNAHVVFLFWGPSFGTSGADHSYATSLQAFRNQFGTTRSTTPSRSTRVKTPSPDSETSPRQTSVAVRPTGSTAPLRRRT